MPIREDDERVSEALPLSPPEYNVVGSLEAGLETPAIDQFEILEEQYDTSKGKNLFKKASNITKRIASDLSHRVVKPISHVLDPICEGLRYLNLKYEGIISRIGNPLVVKRLLYIFFVLGIVIFITRQGNNNGIQGSSGGAFSSNKIYDLDQLGESLRSYVDVKTMKENLEYLSSMPHIAGSTGDLTLGRYVESYMHNSGIHLIDYDELRTFTNYPIQDDSKTYVKLASGGLAANLKEEGKTDMEYLAYTPNALNTDGEIDAPFLFVNFGTQDDLQRLKDNNIELKDTIFLAKYGGLIPEANKVMLANQAGAKAVVFISSKYEVETEGKKKVLDEIIERHDVGLTRFSAGDVLTPGWSSDDSYAVRVPWFKSGSTPKIPTIPISWKDGMLFVKALGKNGVKFDDETYSGTNTNEESHRIKMQITNDQRRTHRIWNIVGSIQGREQDQKGVIIGASRDSSCFGTAQTNTGTAILIELIKMFTSLQREYNWSPARSIYFVSFDSSQYNLAGSAEWIEKRRANLIKNGYAYIDLSDAVAGDELSVKSNPFFHDIIKEVLKTVNEDLGPNSFSGSMYEYFWGLNNNSDEISNNMIEQKNYISFINLINIPALEIKFTGANIPFFSCFDTFENYENRLIDPEMKKHKALAEILGVLILRLTEEAIIPYNFVQFSNKILEYVQDLVRYADSVTKDQNDNTSHDLDFDVLINSIRRLGDFGKDFEEWCKSWKSYMIQSSNLEPSLLAMNRHKWNDKISNFNSFFIVRELPSAREGYANSLFGVSFDAPDNGNSEYQWNTFPKIRDSLNVRDFATAQNEINELAAVFTRALIDIVNG